MTAIDRDDPRDDLDALERRALDDRDALEALLVRCAAIARESHLFSPDPDAFARCGRAIELFDLASLDGAPLGERSREAVAQLSSALGRRALADGAPELAVTQLERARSAALRAPSERAVVLHDLAQCYEVLSDAATAEARWRECLDACAESAPSVERDFYERTSAERLASSARSRNDRLEAQRFERIADACDDREIEREVAQNAEAERFFSAAWDGTTPPQIAHEARWIERSQGVVHATRPSEVTRAEDLVATVECPIIFGPARDDRCLCGAVEGRSQRGVVCDRCGVEVQRAARRRARFGHIELAERRFHPCALVDGAFGSLVSLALDLDPARLALVRSRARCIRYLARSPRGVDTLAPDSEELAAFDAGRGDPAFNVATGDEAIMDALASLDARGARDEVQLELRALRAHKTAHRADVRSRVDWLAARGEALALLEAGASLLIERVPVLSQPRLAEMGRSDAVTPLYEALLGAQSGHEIDVALAALVRAFAATPTHA
ncbi:MAG: hypothetical protein JNK05_22455 [Myxococcales bacterium]|nr:hypothetical protein [Myxococcales bacterium]